MGKYEKILDDLRNCLYTIERMDQYLAVRWENYCGQYRIYEAQNTDF